MDIMSLYYHFTFANGKDETFELHVDSKQFELINTPLKLPAWTTLTFHQCPHCPLDPDTTPHCPLAVNLANVVLRLSTYSPTEQVELEVTMPERTYFHRTTLQTAVGSLMGLIMPASGCPHTAVFKPMARFHVPLANSEETIFRSASTYLMAQYFLHKEGKSVDLELRGLADIYEHTHTVNTSIAERFLAAKEVDSSIDAVVQLDLYAMTFLGIPEEPLDDIRPLFHAYLES